MNKIVIIVYMSDLLEYIKSTFNYRVNIDSKQLLDTPRLKLLDKKEYNVYMIPITYPDFKDKQEYYNELAIKAFNAWSEAIYGDITFKIVQTQHEADIKVFFLSTSRTKVGKQYQEEITTLVPEYNLLGKLCIAVAIRNIENEPLKESDVYHILLHEIGHIFGLGHSPEVDDIMCGGGHFNTEFSQNDLFVLRLVYSIGNNKSFKESEKYINESIAKFQKYSQNIDLLPLKEPEIKPLLPDIEKEETKNIMEDLTSISELKKYNLALQNILCKKSI